MVDLLALVVTNLISGKEVVYEISKKTFYLFILFLLLLSLLLLFFFFFFGGGGVSREKRH